MGDACGDGLARSVPAPAGHGYAAGLSGGHAWRMTWPGSGSCTNGAQTEAPTATWGPLVLSGRDVEADKPPANPALLALDHAQAGP